MLAESQVSGLFLRLFGHLTDEQQYRHEPQIPRIFQKKTFPELAPKGVPRF